MGVYLVIEESIMPSKKVAKKSSDRVLSGQVASVDDADEGLYTLGNSQNLF